MTREIKFRGDNHCKQFIKFDFQHFYFDDDANQVIFDCDKVMGDRGGIERFTFQQFTGLLDKNGKEIYEGDIVNWDRGANVPRQVQWNGTDCEWQAWWKLGFIKLTIYEAERVEVIGNIYENPSLLQ